MRLMVGNNDGWLVKGFSLFVVQVELHARQYLQGCTHRPSKHLVITVAFLLRIRSQQHVNQGQRRDDDESDDEKHQESQEGVEHPFQGQRHLAQLASFLGQPAEDKGRQVTSHEDHRRHTDDGHLCQGTHGGMLGEDQRADADKHQYTTENDTVAVVFQHPLAVGVFVEQALCDENRVVIALTENEGGQNDVHDVELDASQMHDAQNPSPAHRQGQKGQQRQFQAPKREAEEEEHDDAAHIKDVVEVVRQR